MTGGWRPCPDGNHRREARSQGHEEEMERSGSLAGKLGCLGQVDEHLLLREEEEEGEVLSGGPGQGACPVRSERAALVHLPQGRPLRKKRSKSGDGASAWSHSRGAGGILSPI